MPLPALVITATLVAGVTFYLVGLLTGAITLVGWEQRRSVGHGIVSDNSGIQTVLPKFPVWLPAGRAVRADYEVDAEVGSLHLVVARPVIMSKYGSAYVAGQRRGSVVFVARTSGWYHFWADATPSFGRRCHAPGADMIDILTGRDGCPSYDVRYKVAWHLADGIETGPNTVAVPIRDTHTKDRVPPVVIGP